MTAPTLLLVGGLLAKHRYPGAHPNALDRQAAFWDEALKQNLHRQVRIGAPRLATNDELLRFHNEPHVQWVALRSQIGSGALDNGDTPAYPGVYESASARVGTALDALAHIMSGHARRTFQPVGGMHHGRRHRAAGFCPFNDIGVVIETLRTQHRIRRIAYIDIDAHHGDGVFYSYENDPELIIVDVHEDGRFLYPGTGHEEETGIENAVGTKLNIPLVPGAGDAEFFAAWERAEDFLRRQRPEFVILQCGADSLADDPLADLRFSAAAHAHATRRLIMLAEQTAMGRLMVLGGGGYHAGNVAAAWTGVLREMVSTDT